MAINRELEALIQGALDWADQGVPVFPCRADKAPLTENGHKDAVTDPDKVRALFEFYGSDAVLVGAAMGKESGLFTVDIDLYKGPEAEAYFKTLSEQGLLPETRMHKTARGGVHLIYSGTEQPNCKPHSAVEVKGEGGYVIVPPSPGYTVERTGVVDAPKGLLAEFQAARRARSLATDDALRSDILTAVAFHESLTQLAARLARKGNTQLEIQKELLDLMGASVAANPHHGRHPRWASIMRGNEIARLVKSGYSKFNPDAATAAFAEATASDHFEQIGNALFGPSPTMGDEQEEVVYAEGEWPFGPDEGYFAHEARDIENQMFTMYPIFAENETVVIFAEPKTGKTALALSTALCISTGRDLGTLKVVESGPTLYYGLEGKRAIELRIESWKRNEADQGRPVPDHIPMYTVTKHVNFLREDARKAAADQIIAADRYCKAKEGKALKAIYLDTLTKAMSGGDQNSVEDTSHLFDLVSLLRNAGVTATIVFVHHKSRQGNVRGSTNIEAEPDVLLDVSKDDDTIDMHIARARSIEDGMRFRFTLKGYDLGLSSQGLKIGGLYLVPQDGGEADPALGQSFDHADRMKILLGVGKPVVTIDDFFAAVRDTNKQLMPRDERNGGKLSMRPRKATPYVQEYLAKMAPDAGAIFGDKAVFPIKEGAHIIAFKVQPIG